MNETIGRKITIPQLRIIIGAMAMGIILLGIVVIFLENTFSQKTDPKIVTPLMISLAALALAEIPAYIIIRLNTIRKLSEQYKKNRPQENPTEELTARYAVLTIIGSAMAEGVSLFGLVILLLTTQWFVLSIPILGLIILTFLFPTEGKLASFVFAVTGRHWR